MESLLVEVSKVENSLMLVENLIHNIYVYELPEGNLIINLRFNQSKDLDSNLIGGLTATIQEFADKNQEMSTKSISLEEINLLFIAHTKFLIVFAVDPNYPDEQFKEVIDAFIGSFEVCLQTQEYGSSIDGAALAVQTMHNLISEEIHMEIQLGSKVTIYPFKLRELADETAQKLLGGSKSSGNDLYDDTESQNELRNDYEPIKNEKDALNQLLSQFLKTFADVKEITIIRTTMIGEFEQHNQTRLPRQLSDEIYEIVMGMIDTVSHLLEQNIENRCINLEEDGIIIFQKITDLSFLYITAAQNTNVDTLEPIIERIAKSINNLFPDDMVV